MRLGLLACDRKVEWPSDDLSHMLGSAGSSSSLVMIIPHDQINPHTLMALIEEFVTRDGALHGHHDVSAADMSASVLAQLRSGRAVIVFDEETESASIVMKESLQGPKD
jgi:uncharacterized protein